MTTKTSQRLTLRDRLSRLTYHRACQLLGPRGKQLLQAGSSYDTIDIDRDVSLRDDTFRLLLPPAVRGKADIAASIKHNPASPQKLHFHCSVCEGMCEHVGAAVSLVLEEKMQLGLAAAPPERVPAESLGEEALVARALDERNERAREEKFQLQSEDNSEPWTDYAVTSAASGKTYRLALRGKERGQSFCSCPDFRTNTLGTCKHILYALNRIKRKFPASRRNRPYKNADHFVHIQYGSELTLHLRLADNADADVVKTAGALVKKPIQDVRKLVRCLGRLERLGHTVTVYPDAEELIDRRLFQARMADRVAEIRKDPAAHPLRRELLKAELLPYQLDGIAFAAGTGRSILADDMGLGKTIQGIGVAELLAREAKIRRVLVICPASLKSQWRGEVERFSDRDVQLIIGRADERAQQYDNDCFFTVCNYEQVLRDILPIEQVSWDLVILDEGQRIKNWESKTARMIKGLKSQFALVLTGTPLENRLDDLYSIAQFIDDRRLGPAFRFFNRHRIVDEKGKVLGYKNLDELRATLKPVILRRTRDSVLNDLPERTMEIVRIPPTDEQLDLHQSHMRTVSSITRKPYLTEMDLLRLQRALLMCRMSANSTFLVDKAPPGYSTKLERLAEILEQLFAEPSRKTVLFSEWTTMLNLVEPLLEKLQLDFVRLDGKVPQKKRQQLVHRFQNDEKCRLFITTNAGSTGLNLQAANTVINVDLPWNPAVLEQRIARAHRMGQKRPVQVFVLVTEQTIEENLLATLSAKKELSLAVLDPDSDVASVDMATGIEELRSRLEILLGAKPEAPLDVTQQQDVQQQSRKIRDHRDRVAQAGGKMLGAAFQFLGQLVDDESAPAPPDPLVTALHQRLSECVDEDESGRQRLSITLPDRETLGQFANTLARLLVAGEGGLNAADIGTLSETAPPVGESPVRDAARFSP